MYPKLMGSNPARSVAESVGLADDAGVGGLR
jgi:hypothetical protein